MSKSTMVNFIQSCNIHVHIFLFLNKSIISVWGDWYSQVLIYLFLIERVHIVRGEIRSRQEDKLYLLNMVGLIPYCAIGVLAIVFRVDSLDSNGRCLIGIERQTSILVIVYDLLINVFILIFETLTIGVPYHSVFVATSGDVFISPCTQYSPTNCCSTYTW